MFSSVNWDHLLSSSPSSCSSLSRPDCHLYLASAILNKNQKNLNLLAQRVPYFDLDSLSDSDVEMLSCCLELQDCTVKELFLQVFPFSDSIGRKLGTIFEKNHSIRTLVLQSFRSISNSFFLALGQSLRANTTLQVIHFGSCGLCDLEKEAFIGLLDSSVTSSSSFLPNTDSPSSPSLRCLKEIHFRSCHFNGQTSGIARWLSLENCCLEKLSISHIEHLSSDDFFIIAEAIGEKNRSLIDLELDDHVFGDDEGVALGRMLERNSHLKRMTWRDGRMGKDGIRAFILGLSKNTSLRSLDLSHSRLWDSGGEVIGKMLESNSSLRSLNVSFCSVGEAGLNAIALALTGKNHFLREVKLECTETRDSFEKSLETIQSVCNLLIHPKCSLRSLDLRSNLRYFGEKGTLMLIQSAQQNKSLNNFLFDVDTEHQSQLVPSLVMLLEKNARLYSISALNASPKIGPLLQKNKLRWNRMICAMHMYLLARMLHAKRCGILVMERIGHYSSLQRKTWDEEDVVSVTISEWITEQEGLKFVSEGCLGKVGEVLEKKDKVLLLTQTQRSNRRNS